MLNKSILPMLNTFQCDNWLAKQINKKVYVYSVLKNCQPGNLPARIDFSPNKPLSTPGTRQIQDIVILVTERKAACVVRKSIACCRRKHLAGLRFLTVNEQKL